MNDKDKIRELFSDKLGNYEARVKPELWNNIASQIGTAGAATGVSIVTKWVIGLSITAATVITSVIVINTINGDNPAPSSLEAQSTLVGTEENNEVVLNDNENTDSKSLNSQEDQEFKKDNAIFTADQGNEYAENQIDSEAIVENIGSSTSNQNDKEEQPKTSEEESITEKDNPILTEQPIKSNKEEENDLNEITEVIPEPFGPEKVEEQEVQYTIGTLPNVITPNGDRENDILHVESTNLTGFNITILNEQNQVVFQSNNPEFNWDGTDQYGAPVPEGRYVYFITANEFSSDKPKRYSSLTIIR